MMAASRFPQDDRKPPKTFHFVSRILALSRASTMRDKGAPADGLSGQHAFIAYDDRHIITASAMTLANTFAAMP